MNNFKDIVLELNKEVCPVHLKHARCEMTLDGIDFHACCAMFRKHLENKLAELMNPKAPNHKTIETDIAKPNPDSGIDMGIAV